MEFLIVILGLLPGFVWLVFFLKEDIHPEPKRMLAKVFGVGVVFTFIALGLEWGLQEFAKNFRISETSVLSFSVLSAIEEILKFLAAYLVVRKSRFFDEPVDAMIYIIVAALAFATVENVAIALNIISDSGLGEAAGIMVLRFVGATLLHALTSGVVGFYWAKSMRIARLRPSDFGNAKAPMRINNVSLIIKGLVAATALHTIFNYLILIFSETVIYPTIFLIIIAFFVFYDFEKLKN